MPYELQPVLLRFIESNKYKPVGGDVEAYADVRIIAATNREPLTEMRNGRLREDLFYRLHVIPLRMPPLRERDDDVLLLADHFLSVFAAQENKQIAGFSDDARRELKRFPFPGNIRQLSNMIHRLVLMSRELEISYEALRKAISDSELDPSASTGARRKVMVDVSSSPGVEVEPLWVTEKRAIQAALDACDGNINRAAGLLEVAPSTIYRKIQGWKTGDV
jgi:two-component system repressor protein LuxO